MLLIGHRGVGKSSLLQRIQIYLATRIAVPIFDLDREIEMNEGEKIPELFIKKGEAEFRKLELKHYDRLKRSHSFFVIALGAGFPIDQVDRPQFSEIVWVRRASDQRGRIFLDRPRLDPDKSQLKEFQDRFQERDTKYRQFSDWIYDLPEGQNSPSEIERRIIFGELSEIGGCLSLLPYHFRRINVLRQRHLKWGIDCFELRDDLLTDHQISELVAEIESDKLLLSFRKEGFNLAFLELAKKGYKTDWAIEMGTAPQIEPSIFSLHERGFNHSLNSCLRRLEAFAKPGRHLKLAVEIKDFSELKLGIEWQSRDSDNRSFLPSSSEGTWAWARLYLKDKQKLNFWREGQGTSSDQPNLTEWFSHPARIRKFAAVLGHPVDHSFSPAEHRGFFRSRGIGFYAIDLQLPEFDEAMRVLKQLGLKAAAVTSPLKELTFTSCDQVTQLALELKSVNTMYTDGVRWHGDNTDYEGFKVMFADISELGEIVIWGGGGTVAMLLKHLPDASVYSASRQERVRGPEVDIPQTLIWAASPIAHYPKIKWSPKKVIDLNYREDSNAREYALQVGAQYISGLSMFKQQALRQRELWEENL